MAEYDWTGKNINDVLKTSMFLNLKDEIKETGTYGRPHGVKGSPFLGSNVLYGTINEAVIIVNPRNKTLDQSPLVVHHFMVLGNDLLTRIKKMLNDLEVPWKMSLE